MKRSVRRILKVGQMRRAWRIARVWGIVAPLAIAACTGNSDPSPEPSQATPDLTRAVTQTPSPPSNPVGEAKAPETKAPPATEEEVPTPPSVVAPKTATPKTQAKPKKQWLMAPKGADHVYGRTGWIKGVVKLSKPAREALKALDRIDMSADPQCARLHPGDTVAGQQLILGENDAVKNVFVFIRPSDLAAYEIPKAPREEVVLSHKACLFEPRTFGIRTGQTLRLVNPDPVVHKILVERNRPFEAALESRKGVEKENWFETPELGVEFRCGFHIWESAFACVVSHPAWGISNELGQVYIPNVPTGVFTLEFWHPPVPGLKPLEPKKIDVHGVTGGATLFLAQFEPEE